MHRLAVAAMLKATSSEVTFSEISDDTSEKCVMKEKQTVYVLRRAKGYKISQELICAENCVDFEVDMEKFPDEFSLAKENYTLLKEVVEFGLSKDCVLRSQCNDMTIPKSKMSNSEVKSIFGSDLGAKMRMLLSALSQMAIGIRFQNTLCPFCIY